MQALEVSGVTNRDVRAQTFLELGRIRLGEGRVPEARRELEQALATIAETSSRNTEQAVHAALAEVYEQLGNPQQALHHLKRRQEIQEILFNEENRRNLHNFEIRLKVQQAERETALERIRSTELARERERSESLLRNILPDAVALELKDHGRAEPRHFESATVLFTDFVGFTRIAEQLLPSELIAELDRCFSYFDSLMERYRLEKLKTIGDAYMAVGGIPEPNHTHAVDCALAAMEIRQFMTQMAAIKETQGLPYWELRIGMASGPLVAGVVGEKKFAYDVWGDTVNTASRIESTGASGRINIAAGTAALIGDWFALEPRGKIQVKNKGAIDMYYLLGLKPEFSEGGEGRVPNEAFRVALGGM